MKKILLLSCVLFATMMMNAEPFYVRINGSKDVAANPTGVKDYQDRTQYAAFSVSLAKNDKLTCFDGRAKLITVCGGIPHAEIEDRTNDHYDRDFNRLEFTAFYGPADPPLPLPDEIEEIIAFSEKLAEGIPEVRVDSYLIDGKVMFGEMTFYTWAGLIPFDPPEYDEILGSWINLPDSNKINITYELNEETSARVWRVLVTDAKPHQD